MKTNLHPIFQSIMQAHAPGLYRESANNFLTEPETDPELITYVLRRQVKESKKYRRTVPYHTLYKCEDRTRCAFHRRGE